MLIWTVCKDILDIFDCYEISYIWFAFVFSLAYSFVIDPDDETYYQNNVFTLLKIANFLKLNYKARYSIFQNNSAIIL